MYFCIHRRDLKSNCDEVDEIPPNRVNTTDRLEDLREVMEVNNVDVYYVPLDDEGRRKWISGFSGSNGDAIITKERVIFEKTIGPLHVSPITTKMQSAIICF